MKAPFHVAWHSLRLEFPSIEWDPILLAQLCVASFEEKERCFWDGPLSPNADAPACAQARHDAQGEGPTGEEPVQEAGIVSKWRQKERLKTTAVALVLCLNIGVDPPDVIKISPCARLECWVDPLSMQPPKALETIGALDAERALPPCVPDPKGGPSHGNSHIVVRQ